MLTNNRFTDTPDTSSPVSGKSFLTDLPSTTYILDLLNQQSDNYPALKNLIQSRMITPSVVFLPQTLKQLEAEISLRQELLLDCFNFLDVTSLFSLTLYGNSEVFFKHLVQLIVNNRVIHNPKSTLGIETLDELIFTTKEDAVTFIQNNRWLVAIFLFSVISLMFYNKAD